MMCKGRGFANREMVMFTSILISLYDIKPPEGKGWKIPKTDKKVGTRYPRSPIKVWIKRRDLAEKE